MASDKTANSPIMRAKGTSFEWKSFLSIRSNAFKKSDRRSSPITNMNSIRKWVLNTKKAAKPNRTTPNMLKPFLRFFNSANTEKPPPALYLKKGASREAIHRKTNFQTG